MPVPNSAAMSLFSRPAAAIRTILDRKTSRAGVDRPRAQRSSIGHLSHVLGATRLWLIIDS
jgi:hypothetical protein